MKALSYSDITLVPRYSELKSRSQADVSVEFLGRRYALPIIPANMQSVINPKIAHWLSENDYFYIYHRFDVPPTRYLVDNANRQRWKLISISVGVKDEDKRLLERLVDENLQVDVITIDVAHAHSVLVKEMIEFIKGLDFKSALGDYVSDSWAIQDGVAGPGCELTSIPLSYRPKIIAGNVATPEGVRDLAEWGADSVKCGISFGKACVTRSKTGFGVPMFTCAKDCYEKGGPIGNGSLDPRQFFPYDTKAEVPLIFDGGIREIGDIVKGLVAGGGSNNLVMMGSLVAACTDAPGENVYPDIAMDTARLENGKQVDYTTYKKRLKQWLPIKKRYYGSASSRQKGEHKHVEGVELEIPCNGMTVAELYQDIRESLSSAVSYAGGTSLAALKDVQYVEVK